MCSTMVLAASAERATKDTDSINIVVRPAIAGLWGMQIPNKSCVEYYNFKSGNQVIVKSAGEWSTGVYDYQPSNENKNLGALAMQIKYDNNQTDCSGNKEDQSGEATQYFVKWQNTDTIQFCTADKVSQCFVTLRRVLP
ncbi:hypothetical protein FXN70_02200 [Acinetobacter sp. MD2]|nr:hypothetical protein [Acinetobacter sp. MD2]